MEQDVKTKEKVYFVSDAHLNLEKERSDREYKLLRFFDIVKSDGEFLYIVGDLFDFWFEYKYTIPAGYFRVLSALYNLTSSGIKVNYIPGNHDFWMKDYLTKQIGVELTGDRFEADHFGKKILITHGDGIRVDDRGYRFIKSIFRNRFCIWLYSQLPVNIAYRLAMSTSNVSRSHTSSREMKDSTDYIEFAKRENENGFDAVVMGHVHIPEIEEAGPGLYINCGDFIEHYSYVVLDEKGFQLKTLK
ncbi:MAG: UDP-2,3-diacylglucosamine diphosphatase [Candidatus Zixiibacteriota bacterium]|nr:MAG: UDP-2,3-diacylglucosamine diphosphatase [candidate division Zixibacteria bacterium]